MTAKAAQKSTEKHRHRKKLGVSYFIFQKLFQNYFETANMQIFFQYTELVTKKRFKHDFLSEKRYKLKDISLHWNLVKI